MSKIILLQDLDSRVHLAGLIFDKELTEKAKSELVEEGKAAWLDAPKKIKKAVKDGKKQPEIP